MSVQPWHHGTPEQDPAELAAESARRRAEKALEDWARKPMTYNPINNPPGGAAAPEAGDDIALQANTIDVQPVFYRGKQVGERRRVNTRLLIHVQNRLDCDRRRAEDRAERRELLMLKAELTDRSLGIRQLETPAATHGAREMCNEDLGLAAAA